MKFGPSKHFKDVWFAAIHHDAESEGAKKWRLLSHYCYTHESQGDYQVFFFKQDQWQKLNSKQYMMLWKLEAA